jgi:hypothetical protein
VHDMVAKYSDRATANPEVAGVVDRCLNRAGFAVWPSFGPGNYQTPALILSYLAPPESTENPTLSVTLSYPAGVSCTYKDGQAIKITLQSGKRATLRCTRTPADANSALVTVNTDTPTTLLTSGEVWFPPTAKPLPQCTVAKAERISRVVDKFQDWFEKIGEG